VQADAPCALSINGKEVAKLVKGITEVRVSPGQKLVSCVSSEEKVSFEGELEARSGQDTVLRISLGSRVEEIRSARAAVEAQARAECDRGDRSLMQPTVDDGVLRQCGSGLLWTRSDNGSDVDWSHAQSHCRGLGGGWSLPTVAQLQSLYNKDLPGIPCGSGRTCEVSDRFRLSNTLFWSSEPNGSSEAWLVGLFYGDRYSGHVGTSSFRGALCVRRP
jgi:hypothetical protein